MTSILIIDDEPDIREVIRFALEGTGFRIHEAGHTEEARKLLDQVCGNQIYVEERTVDAHVRRLRKVLEPTKHDYMLQTVRGVGYRFSNRV